MQNLLRFKTPKLALLNVFAMNALSSLPMANATREHIRLFVVDMYIDQYTQPIETEFIETEYDKIDYTLYCDVTKEIIGHPNPMNKLLNQNVRVYRSPYCPFCLNKDDIFDSYNVSEIKWRERYITNMHNLHSTMKMIGYPIFVKKSENVIQVKKPHNFQGETKKYVYEELFSNIEQEIKDNVRNDIQNHIPNLLTTSRSTNFNLKNLQSYPNGYDTKIAVVAKAFLKSDGNASPTGSNIFYLYGIVEQHSNLLHDLHSYMPQIKNHNGIQLPKNAQTQVHWIYVVDPKNPLNHYGNYHSIDNHTFQEMFGVAEYFYVPLNIFNSYVLQNVHNVQSQHRQNYFEERARRGVNPFNRTLRNKLDQIRLRKFDSYFDNYKKMYEESLKISNQIREELMVFDRVKQNQLIQDSWRRFQYRVSDKVHFMKVDVLLFEPLSDSLNSSSTWKTLEFFRTNTKFFDKDIYCDGIKGRKLNKGVDFWRATLPPNDQYLYFDNPNNNLKDTLNLSTEYINHFRTYTDNRVDDVKRSYVTQIDSFKRNFNLLAIPRPVENIELHIENDWYNKHPDIGRYESNDQKIINLPVYVEYLIQKKKKEIFSHLQR